MFNIFNMIIIIVCIFVHIKCSNMILKYSMDYICVCVLCETVIVRDLTDKNGLLPFFFFLIALVAYPIYIFILKNYIENKNIQIDKIDINNMKIEKRQSGILLWILVEIVLLAICFLLQYFKIGQIGYLLIGEKILSVFLILTIFLYLYKTNEGGGDAEN